MFPGPTYHDGRTLATNSLHEREIMDFESQLSYNTLFRMLKGPMIIRQYTE
jgi:hypothetical protein